MTFVKLCLRITSACHSRLKSVNCSLRYHHSTVLLQWLSKWFNILLVKLEKNRKCAQYYQIYAKRSNTVFWLMPRLRNGRLCLILDSRKRVVTHSFVATAVYIYWLFWTSIISTPWYWVGYWNYVKGMYIYIYINILIYIYMAPWCTPSPQWCPSHCWWIIDKPEDWLPRNYLIDTQSLRHQTSYPRL